MVRYNLAYNDNILYTIYYGSIKYGFRYNNFRNKIARIYIVHKIKFELNYYK